MTLQRVISSRIDEQLKQIEKPKEITPIEKGFFSSFKNLIANKDSLDDKQL